MADFLPFFIIVANLYFFLYLIYFFMPPLIKKFLPANSTRHLPVSVIIAARNEKKHLEKFLPEILEQQYPQFEVILINDGSSDGTLQYLQEQQKNYPAKLKIISIQSPEGNKKNALNAAIRKASHEVLLFTDADCRPAGPHWIEKMTSHFSESAIRIVLGYGKYEPRKGFLNGLIRFDTLLTALQYSGYALRGMPYMGVGRNLAYRKSLFIETNGFSSHNQIRSGDDDLFVNRNATSQNTTVCLHPDAHTISVPKTSWKQWIRQKRRHITTAPHYRIRHKLSLAGFAMTYTTVFLTLSYGLIMGSFLWISIALLNLTLFGVLLYLFGRQLNDTIPAGMIFVSIPTWIIFQILIFVLNLTDKPVQWK